MLIGASSSALPHGSAADLLDAAKAARADCLDLRAGWNQGWESDLANVADGLPIAFLGVSAVIGERRSGDLPPDDVIRAALDRGVPIRFFSGSLEDEAALRRFGADAEDLRRRWGSSLTILIEPHGTQPTLSQLGVAACRFGVGMVVDLFGLVRLNCGFDEARDFSVRHGCVGQVKGVARRGDSYRHVPLANALDLAHWAADLFAGFDGCITVETKAGSVANDIDLMRRLLRDRPTPAPSPRDISACVPAS